jgi:hypothetical protein
MWGVGCATPMAKRVSVVGRMRASRLAYQGPRAAATPEHAAGTAKPPRDQPTDQSGPRTAAQAGGAAKPARDQPTDQSGPRAAAQAGGAFKPARDQPTGQSGPRAAAHADDAAKPARDQPTEDSQPAEDSSLNQLMTTARDGLRDKDLVVALRARSVACCALTTLMIFW